MRPQLNDIIITTDGPITDGTIPSKNVGLRSQIKVETSANKCAYHHKENKDEANKTVEYTNEKFVLNQLQVG